MVDEPNLDLFPATEIVENRRYLVTTARHVNRILDFCLVVPELVGQSDGKVSSFTEEELHGHLGGVRKPIVLELSSPASEFCSASAIHKIHFPDEGSRQDYLARPFENVPTDLFDCVVSPALFQGKGLGESGFVLPAINKAALKDKYRYLDVCLGGFFHLMSTSQKPDQIRKLATTVIRESDIAMLGGILTNEIVKNESLFGTRLTAAYVELLTTQDIDEGWVSREIFEKLIENTFDVDDLPPEAIAWREYSESVLSGKHPLGRLVDDQNINLRAILLHLLNPDQESLQRLSLREPVPGPKVLSRALTFAAIRLGLAPSTAQMKVDYPGAFFLLGDIAAAKLKGAVLEFDELLLSEKDSMVELRWQGQLVSKVVTSTTGDRELPTVSEPGGMPSLAMLRVLLQKIAVVEIVSEIDEVFKVELDSVTRKKMVKPGELYIALVDDLIILSTRLLDYSIKSHKLTGPKALDAIAYQSEKRGLRFIVKPDDGLFAESNLRIEGPDDHEQLEVALNLVTGASIWFKDSGKKTTKGS